MSEDPTSKALDEIREFRCHVASNPQLMTDDSELDAGIQTYRGKYRSDLCSGLGHDETLFNMEYTRCAKLTVRLHNVPNDCTYEQMVNKLQDLLDGRPELGSGQHLRKIKQLKLSCFKTPKADHTRPFVLASLSVLVPGDDDASLQILIHIIAEIIHKGRFVLRGNIIKVMDWPYTPVKGVVRWALESSPGPTEIPRTLVAAVAAPVLPPPGLAPPPGLVPPPALAIIPPPDVSTEPILPSAAQFCPADEIPEPFGFLPRGLRSPVVDLQYIQPAIDSIDGRLTRLKQWLFIQPRCDENYFTQSTARGCSYWSTDLAFLIGSGSSGGVFLGYFVPTKSGSTVAPCPPLEEVFSNARPVAVKSYAVPKDEYQSNEREWFFDIDLAIFKSTDQGGVVRYYDVVEFDGCVVIVQELGVMTLGHYCASIIGNPSSFQHHILDTKRVIRALCLAVEQLHAVHIVHSDLCLSNIMLTRDGLLKVYNFGKACEESTASANGSCAIDIFALAQLINYLLTPPHEVIAANPLAVSPHICDSMPWMGHLLTEMLTNQSHGLAISDVLRHPVFSSWWSWQACIQKLNNQLSGESNNARSEHNVTRYLELLLPIEKEISWQKLFEHIPESVARHICITDGSKSAQLMMMETGGKQVPHPLPNLYHAVRWSRNFFAL